MPATVTLSTTTLQYSVGKSDAQIKVASSTGLTADTRLYVDRELMSVVSVGLTAGNYTQVNVRRGVDGTTASPHSSSATITIGRGDQFYDSDPAGAPNEAVLVSPYINVVDGTVWYAQGDTTGPEAVRWWQKTTTTYGETSLGVRTSTTEPTSST